MLHQEDTKAGASVALSPEAKIPSMQTSLHQTANTAHVPRSVHLGKPDAEAEECTRCPLQDPLSIKLSPPAAFEQPLHFHCYFLRAQTSRRRAAERTLHGGRGQGWSQWAAENL